MDYSDIARMIVPALGAHVLTYAATRDLGRGGAFPLTANIVGGLQSGDRFFRLDLGFACYYDGTRWLTEHDYPITIQTLTTFSTTSPQDSAIVRLRTDWPPYIVRIAAQTSVNTTNGAANFWTVDINLLNTTGAAATSVWSFTTAGDTLATRTDHEAPPTTAVPTNRSLLRATLTKTGAPGTIELAASLIAKLIIT